MLVFSTRLPLKDETTKDDCMHLFIKWVMDSPNYDIDLSDYDISSDTDFDRECGNIVFSIRHYTDENTEISAIRLENRETTAVWINDCIYLSENGSKSLLIQLNCNRTNFELQMPIPHKPYIVRQFVESGFCKDDCGIPVTDDAIPSDGEFYEKCAEIINGTAEYTMPVVYVSCDYNGKTVLSAPYLAKQLSGVAHVFVEKCRDTATRLRDDTDGNNAHAGYIGIYFPGTRMCQKHRLSYYPDYKAMSREIIDSVWKVLINRLDSSKFNWNHIIALQSRQKMTKWQNISEQDKEQLAEYMDTFDQENKALRDQIDELNSEAYVLRSQLDALRAALNGDDDDACFFKTGAEPNLYASERTELLCSILSQVQQRYEISSRPYTLIQSMLDANPVDGECERVIAGVSSIFGGDARLTKTSKSQLKDLGFSIEEDGPHYKLVFHDPRYMFTVSKTPSDHREGKNLISGIKNMIDVNRKI